MLLTQWTAPAGVTRSSESEAGLTLPTGHSPSGGLADQGSGWRLQNQLKFRRSAILSTRADYGGTASAGD